MATAPFVFQRGETITIFLDDLDEKADRETEVIAKMRQFAPGQKVFKTTDPAGTSFTVRWRPKMGDSYQGWNLIIDSCKSAQLPIGDYGVDAMVTLGSCKVITDVPVVIRITEPAVGI